MRALPAFLLTWTLAAGAAQARPAAVPAPARHRVPVAAAAAPDEATVLMVPVPGKAGPTFGPSVQRLVAQPLRDQVDVLPGPAFAALARRLRLRASSLHTAAGLRRLGHAAGATHVLVVEAVGRRPHLAANVSLVSVRSGRTLTSERYVLVGGHLSPALAAEMLRPLRLKLRKAMGGALGAKNADADEATPMPEDGTSEDPTQALAPDDEMLGEDALEGNAASTDSGIYTRSSISDHMRAPLRLVLGGNFIQREAHLQGDGVGTDQAPCYCSTRSNKNPFFPAVQLGLEFYPGALAGFGDWRGDFGLQADFVVTGVKTRYDQANPSSLITSTLLQLELGATYRHVFGTDSWQPVLQVGLGYSNFSFPLAKGGFPGVSYQAFYLAGQVLLPLGMPQVGLVLGTNLRPGLSAGDGAGKYLGKQTSGFAWRTDVGLRFAFDRFEVQALGRYQKYTASYSGSSSIPDSNSPLNNPKLSDALLQGMLTFSVVF